jgi:hypothetical protein
MAAVRSGPSWSPPPTKRIKKKLFRKLVLIFFSLSCVRSRRSLKVATLMHSFIRPYPLKISLSACSGTDSCSPSGFPVRLLQFSLWATLAQFVMRPTGPFEVAGRAYHPLICYRNTPRKPSVVRAQYPTPLKYL